MYINFKAARGRNRVSINGMTLPSAGHDLVHAVSAKSTYHL